MTSLFFHFSHCWICTRLLLNMVMLNWPTTSRETTWRSRSRPSRSWLIWSPRWNVLEMVLDSTSLTRNSIPKIQAWPSTTDLELWNLCLILDNRQPSLESLNSQLKFNNYNWIMFSYLLIWYSKLSLNWKYKFKQFIRQYYSIFEQNIGVKKPVIVTQIRGRLKCCNATSQNSRSDTYKPNNTLECYATHIWG